MPGPRSPPRGLVSVLFLVLSGCLCSISSLLRLQCAVHAVAPDRPGLFKAGFYTQTLFLL